MKCKGCGREFEPVKNNGCKGGNKGPRLYCSPSCRNKSAQAKYRALHGEKNIERQTEYRKDHPKVNIRAKERRQEDLEHQQRQWRAGNKLRYAVESGKVQKPVKCSNCGRAAKRIEAHHYKGYDFPYDVIWLCTRCHIAVEKIRRAVGN